MFEKDGKDVRMKMKIAKKKWWHMVNTEVGECFVRKRS